MRPLLRLPLCAIASTSLPVFSCVTAMYFHRSTGLSLPSGGSVVYGSTSAACRPSPRKITLRCRLLPPVFEVHSKPMKAVKRPGSLYASADLIVSIQALRYAAVPGIGKPFGSWPLPKLTMMSIAASAPCPPRIWSYHLRPCGVPSSSGSPLISCGKKPMPSE